VESPSEHSLFWVKIHQGDHGFFVFADFEKSFDERI
jgi:hypothetical protein